MIAQQATRIRIVRGDVHFADECGAKGLAVVITGDSTLLRRARIGFGAGWRIDAICPPETEPLCDLWIRSICIHPVEAAGLFQEVDAVVCDTNVDDYPESMAAWWQHVTPGGTLFGVGNASPERVRTALRRISIAGVDFASEDVSVWGVVKRQHRCIQIVPGCDVAVIRGDEGAASWVHAYGRLDADGGVIPRVAPLISHGTTAIDCGAFIGSHAHAYSKLASRVFAFEPNPYAFACLRYNCPSASCHNVALGEKRGELYWHPVYPNCGGSNVVPHGGHGAVTVPVRALDSYEIDGDVSLMKVDVEGEEVRVLRGAAQLIARCRPALCIEVNAPAMARSKTTPAELHDLLRSWKYAWTKIQNVANDDEQHDIIARPE